MLFHQGVGPSEGGAPPLLERYGEQLTAEPNVASTPLRRPAVGALANVTSRAQNPSPLCDPLRGHKNLRHPIATTSSKRSEAPQRLHHAKELDRSARSFGIGRKGLQGLSAPRRAAKFSLTAARLVEAGGAWSSTGRVARHPGPRLAREKELWPNSAPLF